MLKRLAATLEAAIYQSAIVVTYDLDTVQVSPNTGYVEGEITFKDDSQLSFFEFLRQTDRKIEREKYRYHFMDTDNRLIFRYDNAPHHPEIATSPHHKHLPTGVLVSTGPYFADVLAEVESYVLGIP